MTISSSPALTALDVAQTNLNRAVVRVAKDGPSPEDAVALSLARIQFEAGIKALKTEDDLTRKTLDLFA